MSNLYLYECFHCSKVLSLKEVLDFACVCDKRWIVFVCPYCDGYSIHATLYEGQINIGILDGFPGPAFRQHAVMRTPKLRWKYVEQGVYIQDSGRQWLLKWLNGAKIDGERFHCEMDGKKWVFEPEDLGNGDWRYIPIEEK
ncbi:MAG: hypothetical protein ACYTFX_09505 [Planctomycetota bacterium]|jgi:hypothetical protein